MIHKSGSNMSVVFFLIQSKVDYPFEKLKSILLNAMLSNKQNETILMALEQGVLANQNVIGTKTYFSPIQFLHAQSSNYLIS